MEDRPAQGGEFLLLVRPSAGLIGPAAGNFIDGNYLWVLVALVVVGSIVIHGIAATPVMHSIDLRRMRKARRKGKSPEETTI
jgi:NhaP-type Na+/H+ or K+/H+ antiporter